ncbi:hypothetical protein STEG23_006824, partial [Scotinomys teguina]
GSGTPTDISQPWNIKLQKPRLTSPILNRNTTKIKVNPRCSIAVTDLTMYHGRISVAFKLSDGKAIDYSEIALILIIFCHLFLLGEFAFPRSRALRSICTMTSVRLLISLLRFDLVNLSIGWTLPSSDFCKAGLVDRLGLFMVSQISWTFCFMTFLDLVFSLTDESISSIQNQDAYCHDFPKTYKLSLNFNTAILQLLALLSRVGLLLWYKAEAQQQDLINNKEHKVVLEIIVI